MTFGLSVTIWRLAVRSRLQSSREAAGWKKKEKKKRRVQREIPTFFSRQHSFAVLSRSRHVLPRPSVISVHLVCVCVGECVTAGAHQKRSIKTSISLRPVRFRAVGWPRPLCFLWALCVFLPRMPLYKAACPKGSALPHLVGVQHYTHTHGHTHTAWYSRRLSAAALWELLVKIDPLSGSSSVLLK